MSTASEIVSRSYPHGQYSRSLAERMAEALDGVVTDSSNWSSDPLSYSPTERWEFSDGSILEIAHAACVELTEAEA